MNRPFRINSPAMGFCWQDMVCMRGAKTYSRRNAILRSSNIFSNAKKRGHNMATLRRPDKNVTLGDPSAVRQFLGRRGIVHERWSADRDLPSGASNEQVLAAYDYLLKPFMEKCGYQTMDVIRVDGD